MLEISSTDDFLRLLDCDTIPKAEAFFKSFVSADVFNSSANWKPVGGLESNAGSIEASADEVNPIVERIVNAMEANIELRYELADEDKKSRVTDLPAALEHLFGMSSGGARMLLEPDDELSSLVTMEMRGTKANPTISIRDKGIGVHPNNFDSTLLSLQQSDKGKKPYLIGMYGQGGSSTFERSEYTIIVSRKHPELLSEGQADEGGFTVVRRSLEGRAHVYSYLVDPETDSVPKISSNALDGNDFGYGTIVTSINYRGLGSVGNQRITNNAYYTLNYRLFNPPIPWKLVETRAGMNPGLHGMRGVSYRLDQIGPDYRSEASVRHHSEFNYQNSEFGSLLVEMWVLEDTKVIDGRRRMKHAERLATYRDRTRRYARRRLAITRGGQVHAALDPARIFNKKGLRHVGRSVIVEVNTDRLSNSAGASFFASNRADLKSESEMTIENAVEMAIETYQDDLRGIERNRHDEALKGKGATDADAIRGRLNRLIDSFTRRSESSQKGGTKSGRSKKFRGRAVPTFLKWARTTPLEVRAGVPTRAYLLTDALDSVVRNSMVECKIDSSEDFISPRLVSGKDGRWRVDLTIDPATPIGTFGELTARLTNPGVWTHTTESQFRVEVVPPPPPYIGSDPPTIFRIRNHGGNTQIRPGVVARLTIETDGTDALLDNADLKLDLPDSATLIGHGAPIKGDIRVSVKTEPDLKEGLLGRFVATLTLANGVVLKDSAEIQLLPPINTGTNSGPRPKPNFDIVDVKQMPQSDKEISWTEVANNLGVDTAWTKEDVAGLDVYQENNETRKLIFYLNGDNDALIQAERRITASRSETGVEAARVKHRTLQCYYLYLLATSRIQADKSIDIDEYSKYRSELIRLNETLLYAQKEFEFGETIDDEEDS
jgi:hypothetical protein